MNSSSRDGCLDTNTLLCRPRERFDFGLSSKGCRVHACRDNRYLTEDLFTTRLVVGFKLLSYVTVCSRTFRCV
jgi:hypothetical protein